MDYPNFPLLCTRGGKTSITFKSHYVNIHNERKETIENSILPYGSICFVEEEHLGDGQTHLHRVHIVLNNGVVKTIETSVPEHYEQILLNLLRNTIHPSKG